MIASQRSEIDRLKSLEHAHAILRDREWFTLFDAKEEFYLHRLFRDSAASLCSIGVGDVALIGRAKKQNG